MTSRPNSRGYTLVEILVALTLTLMLMTVVVRVFGGVGDGIRKSRSALEQFDRLRTAAMQLKADLGNVTARPDGRAARPEEAPGYLEIVEGSSQFVTSPVSGAIPYYAFDLSGGSADYTVGERGDMIMFTARNAARPYVGRFGYSAGNAQTIQSDVAEICWFLRGNRLHRRVLLVVPGAAATVSSYSPAAFYNDYDLSVRMVSGNSSKQIVPNSLADLTKRENRFGHDARGFPYDVRGWGTYGLPTLAECTSNWMSATSWQSGSTPPPQPGPPQTGTSAVVVDMWDNSPSGPLNTNFPDQALGTNGARIADDVILNNVLEFDVKVWEPAVNGGAGGYVDLGTLGATTSSTPSSPIKLVNFTTPQGPTYPRFNNGGIQESGLSTASGSPACVYDTGCFAYLNELGNSEATNGLDDNGNGVVDDTLEAITSNNVAPGISPYPVPLRGIQIKVRCFDPDSRQIREISIENDFLPK